MDGCVALYSVGNRVIASLCNDPRYGVVLRRVKCSSGKCREVTERVLTLYIEDAEVYDDMYTGIRYVRLRGKDLLDGRQVEINIDRLDKMFIHWLRENFGLVTKYVDLEALINAFGVKKDVMTDGFVCGDGGCRVSKRFGVVFDTVNPEAAKVAIGMLYTAAELHPDGDKYMTFIKRALFTSFSLAQRQHGVAPKSVLLTGPWFSGKTVTASIVAKSFINDDGSCHVARPASYVMSIAKRLGLMCNTTTPYALDKVDRLRNRELFMTYVKTFIEPLGQTKTKYPPYAGIVMTARIKTIDGDFISHVEFSSSIPTENAMKFNRDVLKRLREHMPYLAAYYLHYAEKNWDKVKDIIINKASENWEDAAETYFREVEKSLQ